MNYFNMRTITNPDTFWGVYFQDKIIEGVYHSFDNEEFLSEESAKNHLKEIEDASSEYKGRLIVFKITVEALKN
jgi:hypothetical protein